MVEKKYYDALNILRDEFMATAKSKGFYSNSTYELSKDLAAMHAEVSELYEAEHHGTLDQDCDKTE